MSGRLQLSAKAIRAKTAIPLDGWGLMNVTYCGSGWSTTMRSNGIGSGMIGPSWPSSRLGGCGGSAATPQECLGLVQALRTWGILPQPPLLRPPHQLKAGRMPAVGQEHAGPEPVEDLLGQLEKDHRLARVGRPLGATGRRRHDRHPHAVDPQVDHLGRFARFQFAWNRRIGSSSMAKPSSSDVSRSGSRMPVVSTLQSIPRAASSSSNSRVHKAAPLEGSR